MQQNIIQGIDKLPQIITALNRKKILVVAGSSYQRISKREYVDMLNAEKVFFSDFTPNPVFDDICKGVKLFVREKCDVLLAVGGGSAIDVAKCIKLAVLAKEGINAIIPPIVNMRVACDGIVIPFVAIPTTAGSGSESTHNAVMYYEGTKQTITNDAILPDYAILDPSVLDSLPLYQKKCTMMDALCQGIESWWSVNSTMKSQEYSRKAIELIMQNWRDYIFNNDSEAAAKIMLGANYSGRAISIAQTTAAHAMSYMITSLYGLPHGHAVAICLPEIWEYMEANIDKCVDPRGSEYLRSVFTDITLSIGVESHNDAIRMLRSMLKDVGLANPVTNEREQDLSVLSSSVNTTRLKNNPIELDKDAIEDLYKVVLK